MLSGVNRRLGIDSIDNLVTGLPTPLTNTHWFLSVSFSRQRERSLVWLDGSKTRAQELSRGSYKGHVAG